MLNAHIPVEYTEGRHILDPRLSYLIQHQTALPFIKKIIVPVKFLTALNIILFQKLNTVWPSFASSHFNAVSFIDAFY